MNEVFASLELAHCRLLDLRAFEEREEIVESFDAMLVELYQCLDDRFDPLNSVRGARHRLSNLGTEFHDLSSELGEIDRLLSDTERSFSLKTFRTPEARPILKAGYQSLLLRHLDRPLLAPPSKNADFVSPFLPLEQMDDPDEAFIEDPLPAFSPNGWAHQRLEEFFSDICALGSQRTPQMGDAWRSALFIEQRLVCLMDAAYAIEGTSLSYLEQQFLSSPAPDPMALFGLALLGGSLSGRDGLAMSERCYRVVEDEPEFDEALEEAWGLLPNPLVESIMRAWLGDARAGRRRLAVQVLVRRQSVQAEELERALVDEDRVAAAALVPYVLQGGLHTRHFLDEFSRVVHDDLAPDLLEQLHLAGVLAAYPHSSTYAAERCKKGELAAAPLIGVSATCADAERLRTWTMSDPNESLIVALGWAGDPACLPLLIALLALEDQALVIAAASSLERITGAGLLDWVEVSPDAAMENDASLPPVEDPLTDSMVLSEEEAVEASPEMVELPSCDPERWRSYCLEHEKSLVPGVRTRKGLAHSPLVSMEELDRGACTPSERRILHWELIVRTGIYFHFDERAFVHRQEDQLGAIREALSAKQWLIGDWGLPLERNLA